MKIRQMFFTENVYASSKACLFQVSNEKPLIFKLKMQMANSPDNSVVSNALVNLLSYSILLKVE